MNNIKLFNNDCFDELKNIKDKSINLVLIDPPYNIGVDKWDKWKNQEDYYLFMSNIFKECKRVLKDNGTLLWFHSDRNQYIDLIQNCRKTGFKYISELIIYKENFRTFNWKNLKKSNTLRSWFNVNEYCFHFVKDNKTNSKNYNSLNKIKFNKEFFLEFRKYAKELKDKINLNTNDINKIMGNKTCDHFFRTEGVEFTIPIEKNYNLLLSKFNLKIGENLNNFKILKYKDLKEKYNNKLLEHTDLFNEYEKERYVFNKGFLKENKNVYHLKNNMSNNNNNKKIHKHCTPKNIQLLEDLIRTHSNENDLVLDCFMGTGTTGIACINTNRDFIGIEINKDYFNYSKTTIEEYQEELKKDKN